jgi:ATP-binding cassette subfamily F protein 3
MHEINFKTLVLDWQRSYDAFMLNVSNLSKVQGGESLYSNVNFQINPGEKVGLVGPNGTGKTTLFRIIIGETKSDTGQVSFPEKMRLGYFSQNVGELKGKSALEVVMGGDEKIGKLQAKLSEFEAKLCDPEIDPDEMNKILEQMGDVQTEFEKRGGYDLQPRAEEVLTGLGIMPADHHKDLRRVLRRLENENCSGQSASDQA